jgi:hypothetical protein
MRKINKKSWLIGLGLLACALSASASETDWTLRIKQEAKRLAISLDANHEYGPRAGRIKGSGILVERKREIGSFSKLRIEGPLDVQLNQGAAESLSISAEDNVEPLIETRLDGDALVIGLKPGAGFSTRKPPRLMLGFRKLNAVLIKGSGDVNIDQLKAEQFAITISGSGDLDIGLLETRELSASISGSGDVHIAGRAEQQNWSLSGSGDVSAASLSGRTAKAQLSGSGDLSLGVVEQLDANLSGSGDLSYAGRPKVTQKISGSGEISAR